MNNQITCPYCGKEFTSKQSRAAHYRYCEIHLKELGIYEECKQREHMLHTRMAIKAGELSSQRSKERKSQRDFIFSQQNKNCECCGKLLTTKFGSGRFCSRSCANKHERNPESRYRTSQSLNKDKYRSFEDFLTELNRPKKSRNKKIKTIDGVDTPRILSTPRLCCLCGKEIPKNRSYSRYCSNDCGGFDHRGGLRITSSRGKRGTYKGFHCDSTYELAFVIYCLDHNIRIERCVEYFTYVYEGRLRRYYPDFYLPDYDKFIETKGYKNSLVEVKGDSVPADKYIYLDHEGLMFAFDYIRSQYRDIKISTSTNNLYLLYDNIGE